MNPILVLSGEPSGIGPDIVCALANSAHPTVVAGNVEVLSQRAKMLGYDITFSVYDPKTYAMKPNHIWVLPFDIIQSVQPGTLDIKNAPYVIDILSTGVQACLDGSFSAIVTAPVHKAILQEAGYAFTGHTEFFQKACGVHKVVMMLVAPSSPHLLDSDFRVALMTTHIPLSQVPEAMTTNCILDTVRIVHHHMQRYEGIPNPIIKVAGLNPHAGEGGYMGKEEQEVMIPAITFLQKEGINVQGPFSADTLFVAEKADVFIAVYHDQGLPVLKYASFGKGVNVTLGLPIIRTSVDHGTALTLAGSGKADPSSLLEAVHIAAGMCGNV